MSGSVAIVSRFFAGNSDYPDLHLARRDNGQLLRARSRPRHQAAQQSLLYLPKC